MSVSNLSVSQPRPYSVVAATAAASGPAPPMNHANAEKLEDCRDYLRTGRCKYGASCKYYHPPNVQSGGGMKTPLNPTEPMFPIRPNEPICQYFIKHGTCKFGQACKFHHPALSQQPHYATTAPAGASPMLLSVGHPPGRRVEPATQLVAVGPPGAEMTHMMVQFLPQRPEEPDCIYFLKNGRCKYGATCRYHHPIQSLSSQPHTLQPRQQTRNPRGTVQNDPYLSAATATPATGKRMPYVTQPTGILGQPPGHVLVTPEGGPVSFVSVDQGAHSATAYKPVTLVAAGGEVLSAPQTQYVVPTGGGTAVFSGSTAITEQGSSASSIASSFDTTSSSLDLTGTDATAAALWTRARKNGSGGSLNAFVDNSKPRAAAGGNIPSSASDGNIARRAHSNSLGSAAEYHAEAGAPQRPPPGWRNRSSSFDQSKQHDVAAPHEANQVAPPSHPSQTGRPPMAAVARSGRHRQSRGPDEGFTMMTSALLNMLDTQEETSAEAYSEDDGSYDVTGRLASTSEDGSYTPRYTTNGQSLTDMATPSALMEQLTLNPNHAASSSNQHLNDEEALPSVVNTSQQQTQPNAQQWSPTWNREDPRVVNAAAPHPQHANAHHPLPPPNSGNHVPPSDFGLYLP